MVSSDSDSNRSYMVRQSVAMSVAPIVEYKSNNLSNSIRGRMDMISISNVESSINSNELKQGSVKMERLEPS